MTIENKIKEMLVEHGMWDDQAKAVVEMMKADEVNEPMAHRWNDNVGDYPQVVMTLLWAEAKATALKYIDVNCPEAWFRPMFVIDSLG